MSLLTFIINYIYILLFEENILLSFLIYFIISHNKVYYESLNILFYLK